ILWTISNWQEKRATKILWLVGVAIVLLAVDEQLFFFPMAMVFSLLAAALVFISIFKISKVS
ncbi:hypothetical protein ACI394_29270, partial [Klebsiella pneumoniae]|uniref:hypothetical protein n=1 Tax=Klebsiella pneumoniae TaxID=573 RepID=UPI0038531C72